MAQKGKREITGDNSLINTAVMIIFEFPTTNSGYMLTHISINFTFHLLKLQQFMEVVKLVN